MPINPVHFAHSVCDEFLRYLFSAFPLSDPEAVLEANDLSWDTGFFRQEWEQVVQANGVQTQDEYLRVPRLGRGRTVSRPQRARIWRVFEHYRHALGKRSQQEWLEVIQSARRYVDEKKPKLPYRAVVV